LLLGDAGELLGGIDAQKTPLRVNWLISSSPYRLIPPPHELPLIFELGLDGLHQQRPVLDLLGILDDRISFGIFDLRLLGEEDRQRH
jgi:hypothetical protein